MCSSTEDPHFTLGFDMKIDRKNINSGRTSKVQQGLTGLAHEKSVCDFLKDPLPECYCKHLSSRNVPRIVQFCAGDFKLCRVYLDHAHLLKS